MNMTHRISIERNPLRFAAAHMATFGGKVEPLHGHNYEVIVHIAGALSADSWVIDFGEAQRLVRDICLGLDHRLILAAQSKLMRIAEESGVVTILTNAEKRYVVPTSDVVLLDTDNTTSERIAEWFAGRLAEALADAGATNLTSLTVGLAAMPGQARRFTRPRG